MSLSKNSVLLLVTYYLCLVFGQTRNYTVGIKVSNVWYSGSGDTMYFTLCRTTTVNATAQEDCTKWYEIDGGMENRGDWYNFYYPDAKDVGNPTSMKLLTRANDQFCVTAVSMEGVKYEADGVGFECMEVADSKPSGSCSVIDIEFGVAPTATFTNEIYEGGACLQNTSMTNTYSGPPITTANGTRTYELSLTVSSLFYSGTKDPLYLRLCTDSTRATCTQKCDDAMTNCVDDWYIFSDGVNEEGNTYKGFWNTKDIGDINYAYIVIFGSDNFCLSRIKIDGKEANAGTTPECISDDSQDGCTTLGIDLTPQTFTKTETEQCTYGLVNNETFVEVDQYIFKFKIGNNLACGAESVIYFIFCSADGNHLEANLQFCSDLYEIGGEMPDEGKEYTYSVDITKYSMFNTIDDIYFVDVFEYETERWCLSDITINGLTASSGEIKGPNWDATPATALESPVNDGIYCNGVRAEKGKDWYEWTDGPEGDGFKKGCRWNTKKTAGPVTAVSSKSDNETILDWVNSGYNWVYLCVGLIVLMICCIIGCACLQQMKKKKEDQVEDTNRPWHGGNSAFYG